MRFLILSVALLLAPAGAIAGNGTDLLAAQRMAHRLLAVRARSKGCGSPRSSAALAAR